MLIIEEINVLESLIETKLNLSIGLFQKWKELAVKANINKELIDFINDAECFFFNNNNKLVDVKLKSIQTDISLN